MLSRHPRAVQWAAPIVRIGPADGAAAPPRARRLGCLRRPYHVRLMRSILVVGAHAADFVWRAAGTVALHTTAGWGATVVALSYGERGESGDLWREAGQNVDNVKRIRHGECSRAAAATGA